MKSCYTVAMHKITTDTTTPSSLQTFFTQRQSPLTEVMLEEALDQLSYLLAEYKAYRTRFICKASAVKKEEIGYEDIAKIEYFLSEDNRRLLPVFTGIEKEEDSPFDFDKNSHVYACDTADLLACLEAEDADIVINPGSDDLILSKMQLARLVNHADTTV